MEKRRLWVEDHYGRLNLSLGLTFIQMALTGFMDRKLFASRNSHASKTRA
jgi:hypothetical protein